MKIANLKNGDIRISNRNDPLIAISILSAFMSAGGIAILYNLISCFQFRFEDYFGVAFVSVWLCFVFGIGAASFVMFSKVLTLNSKGVTSKSIVKSRTLAWSDMKDWGLSYCGQTRFEGNTYYLYFSEKVLETKNEERKKVKGVKFRAVVLEREFDEAVETVLDYGKKYTDKKPFVPIKKNHVF